MSKRITEYPEATVFDGVVYQDGGADGSSKMTLSKLIELMGLDARYAQIHGDLSEYFDVQFLNVGVSGLIGYIEGVDGLYLRNTNPTDGEGISLLDDGGMILQSQAFQTNAQSITLATGDSFYVGTSNGDEITLSSFFGMEMWVGGYPLLVASADMAGNVDLSIDATTVNFSGSLSLVNLTLSDFLSVMGDATFMSNVTIEGDLVQETIYFGDPLTDGTSRLLNNAGAIRFETRESGVYVLGSAEISGASIKLGNVNSVSALGRYIGVSTTTGEEGIIPFIKINPDGSTGLEQLPTTDTYSGRTVFQPDDSHDTGAVASGFEYVTPPSQTPDNNLIQAFYVRRGNAPATGDIRLRVYLCDATGSITLDSPIVEVLISQANWNSQVEHMFTVPEQFEVDVGQYYLNRWAVLDPITGEELAGGTLSLLGTNPPTPIPGPTNFAPWFALNSRTLTTVEVPPNLVEYKAKCSRDEALIDGSFTMRNGNVVGAIFSPAQMGRFNRIEIDVDSNLIGPGDSGALHVAMYKYDPTVTGPISKFDQIPDSADSVTINGTDGVTTVRYSLPDAFTIENPAIQVHLVVKTDSFTNPSAFSRLRLARVRVPQDVVNGGWSLSNETTPGLPPIFLLSDSASDNNSAFGRIYHS